MTKKNQGQQEALGPRNGEACGYWNPVTLPRLSEATGVPVGELWRIIKMQADLERTLAGEGAERVVASIYDRKSMEERCEHIYGVPYKEIQAMRAEQLKALINSVNPKGTQDVSPNRQ